MLSWTLIGEYVLTNKNNNNVKKGNTLELLHRIRRKCNRYLSRVLHMLVISTNHIVHIGNGGYHS